MCDLLPLAGPIATILAAAAAVYVTWRLGKGQIRITEQQKAIAQQQADLAAVRLQHDLFDRRFEIYQAVRGLLSEVFERGNISNEGLGNFVRGTDKAVFFFDQGITDYLSELRRHAIVLQEVNSTLSDPALPNGAAAQRKGEISTWLVEQFEVLVQKFKPFLALDENTASRGPAPSRRCV